jgi:hypothetical protein
MLLLLACLTQMIQCPRRITGIHEKQYYPQLRHQYLLTQALEPLSRPCPTLHNYLS